MPFDTEADKRVLIEQLVAVAEEQASGERISGEQPGDAATVPSFLRGFYRNVAAESMMTRSRADLLAAASSAWAFAAERHPGRAKIRILESPIWAAGRSVVEIVNDDMPFLVDSVTAALNRAAPRVRHIIHPIFNVVRDADGTLKSLSGDTRESVMQIEMAGILDAAALAAVRSELDAVLQDVRAIVLDWNALRYQTLQIADDLTAGHVPLSIAEITETASFLKWLTDENFIFLGYRDYGYESALLSMTPGTGRGLLRDDDYIVFEELRGLRRLPAEVRHFLQAPGLMMISKARRRSTVHRPAPLDTIVLKRFGADGSVAGLRLLIGLFTSTSYSTPSSAIPVVRHKVARCLAHAGFASGSHDDKALRHILDNFPRDELFQIDEQQLTATALGILHLQQRPRIALFVRRDPFRRFVSCLVYLPRERYSETLRARYSEILSEAFGGGAITGEATHLDESSPLARLNVTIDTPEAGELRDLDGIERALIEAARTWNDRFDDALQERHGPATGAVLLRRYAAALPANYTERFSAASAVADIGEVENILNGAPMALALYRAFDDLSPDLRLKTFHPESPIPLSDVLPVLENLGLRVINEIPYECRPLDAAAVVIQEFQVTPRDGRAIDLDTVGAIFEAALPLIWSGVVENDGFNRLVPRAGLSAPRIVILRTYSKIIRQAGGTFSQAYMEDTMAAYPHMARLLVALFEARFDPALGTDREAATGQIEADIAAELDRVGNLDEDRILRNFLELIRQTLRTNYYQRGSDGAPKSYLAVKLASRDIELLPLPRPMVEIYLYSPRVEGCHLRGGLVARGGIRWSDRKEDFRTEILGLMKAQVVKNAVIVPGGSKGGFVVKRPPAARDQLMAEVVACYKTLMSALLDLTDTIDGETIVSPPDVVRHDGDDPYLVVAADKGTATFSDIANGVAAEYGFWLGDAFASGGSIGYDHKAMGITARGAWEAVKRHFRELGTDIQTTPFSCIGVGDMSGDVFGNGMLLSTETKLVAAFDHRHIFIDPDPDPAVSWAERKRLFGLPGSNWADYDPALISAGGGVYERGAKSITLGAEAAERFGLPAIPLSPPQLIQRLLTQPVDLLWFGGIGTYVKASSESHADAGDRANDSLRVDASMLRAKVVGEGANLAMTQRGRIEFALKGGRLNTDAIDNSAGVDTSDHEVNIKIAVADMMAAGHLTPARRTEFLASMTDEVAALVLEDNYLQTAALSVAEAQGERVLDQHVRLMRVLERSGQLNRAIEFLPDEEALAQRATAKRGLVRPELAVLLAYAKNALNEELAASSLPDDPAFEADLIQYFPKAIRDVAAGELTTHRLRREIIATRLANEIVNRLGPSFVVELQARTGRSAADIVRAYRIAAHIFDFAEIWRRIEACDGKFPAASQVRLLVDVAIVAERAVRWLLQFDAVLDTASSVTAYRPGVVQLASRLPALLPDGERRAFGMRVKRFTGSGVPEALAERVVALANLAAGLDIVRLGRRSGADTLSVGALYYETGERFGLDTLRDAARGMPAESSWQKLAAAAVLDDFYDIQSEIVGRVLAAGTAQPTLAGWIGQIPEAVARIDEMIAEVTRATSPDLAMLTVVARQLRAVI